MTALDLICMPFLFINDAIRQEGGWEGEMDFEKRNMFGGGEVISVAVK